MLVNVPAAYASTCNSSGGQRGDGYYYAGEQDGDTTNAYGVGAHSTPYTWTLNTATSSGHMLLWVNLGYSISIRSWSQTGLGIGLINPDIGTSNSRNVYMEFVNNLVTQSGSYLFGTSIPDNDQGYLEAWTYSYDAGTGHYTARGEAYSPIWSTYYVSSADMGPNLRSGPVSTSIEALYITYSGTCDNYSQYTATSGAVYTTSTQGSEPLSAGFGWGSCALNPNPSNPPYSVSVPGLCSQTVDYWGG